MNLFRISIAVIALTGCRNPQEDSITIAAAANVQFALEEITEAFTRETGIPCSTTIGSSGTLTAQILADAPFDVFLSADMKYPEQLFSLGKTTNEAKVYAYGALVLWTLSDSIISVPSLQESVIKKIAMANPKTAPYGVAAEETLRHFGIYQNVQDKLVFGGNISQTTQFILSRGVDAGFTSKSVVVSPEWKNTGKWVEIDTAAYSPIAQGAVIIQHDDKDAINAQLFYDFLFTESARNFFLEYGYTLPRSL